MSRLEIAAAARALCRTAPAAAPLPANAPANAADSVVSALVLNCAAAVRAEPTYRRSLVMRLANRVHLGTYVLPAGDIADQLLGRLLAAALPE